MFIKKKVILLNVYMNRKLFERIMQVTWCDGIFLEHFWIFLVMLISNASLAAFRWVNISRRISTAQACRANRQWHTFVEWGTIERWITAFIVDCFASSWVVCGNYFWSAPEQWLVFTETFFVQVDELKSVYIANQLINYLSFLARWVTTIPVSLVCCGQNHTVGWLTIMGKSWQFFWLFKRFTIFLYIFGRISADYLSRVFKVFANIYFWGLPFDNYL